MICGIMVYADYRVNQKIGFQIPCEPALFSDSVCAGLIFLIVSGRDRLSGYEIKKRTLPAQDTRRRLSDHEFLIFLRIRLKNE